MGSVRGGIEAPMFEILTNDKKNVPPWWAVGEEGDAQWGWLENHNGEGLESGGVLGMKCWCVLQYLIPNMWKLKLAQGSVE